MSPWFIYLFTRLESINEIIRLLSVLTAVLVPSWIVIGFMAQVIEKNDYLVKPLFKYKTKLIIFVIMILSLNILVPTTKEAAAIYLLPKIVNNENISHIPNKALDVLNNKFDLWIEETLREKNSRE
jgi:hypothetical protein